MKKLTAIIINYNTAAMTTRAVQSFLDASINYEREVILIDNASTNPITWNNQDPVKLLVNSSNLGFAKAVNQGLKIADSDFILLLNSDVLINQEALDQMLLVAQQEEKIGLLGPAFYFPNQSFQPSCGRWPNFWREFARFFMLGKVFSTGTLIYQTFFNKNFFKSKQVVDWLSGGCLLIKKSVVERIGLFDENFFFGVEDFDYCYRAKQAGYQVVYLPQAKIIHYHAFSSGGHGSAQSLSLERVGMKYFLKKYYTNNFFFRFFDDALYGLKIFILDKLRGRQ